SVPDCPASEAACLAPREPAAAACWSGALESPCDFDQRTQIVHLLCRQVADRGTDAAGVMAHQLQPCLDDRHRIAVLAIADRRIGDKELGHRPPYKCRILF